MIRGIDSPIGWERTKFGLLVPGVRVKRPKLPHLPGLIPLPDGSGWLRVPLQAVVAHVQTTGANPGSVSSDTLAYPSNVTAGNFLVCVARCGAAGSPITVDDNRNGGTDWTLAGSRTQANDGDGVISIHFFPNTAGGACSVTVTLTAGAILRYIIMEFSGVATASPQDGAAAGNEGDSATIATGTLTPSAAGALFVCGGFASGALTFTQGTDFTIPSGGVVPAAPSSRLAAEYFIQGSAAAHDGTFGLSTSELWAGVMAVFKAAAAGGASNPPMPWDRQGAMGVQIAS